LKTYTPSLLNQNQKLSFSGHETFPFRYSWLPKGVQNVNSFDNLFARDDAVVILGVGKNMVKSIQHWCKVLGLIYSPERGKYKVTELGEKLFGNTGYDPYLEDPGTLWLLHWQLTSRLETASTYYLGFTVWNIDEFSRAIFEDWLFKTSKLYPSTHVTINSIHRDVDVFLRTYLPAETNRKLMTEDTFDCPLVELGLIEEIENSGTFRFIRGPKPSLPSLIFLYSLLDYWETLPKKTDVISYEKILHNMGSPGVAFRLNENALTDYLETLPSWCGFVYDDTAGMRNIYRRDTKITKLEILKRYYQGDNS